MRKFFAVTYSHPAPHFPDKQTQFVRAWTPKGAMKKIRSAYRHPSGLACVQIYANDKDERNSVPLAHWGFAYDNL